MSRRYIGRVTAGLNRIWASPVRAARDTSTQKSGCQSAASATMSSSVTLPHRRDANASAVAIRCVSRSLESRYADNAHVSKAAFHGGPDRTRIIFWNRAEKSQAARRIHNVNPEKPAIIVTRLSSREMKSAIPADNVRIPRNGLPHNSVYTLSERLRVAQAI